MEDKAAREVRLPLQAQQLTHGLQLQLAPPEVARGEEQVAGVRVHVQATDEHSAQDTQVVHGRLTEQPTASRDAQRRRQEQVCKRDEGRPAEPTVRGRADAPLENAQQHGSCCNRRWAKLVLPQLLRELLFMLGTHGHSRRRACDTITRKRNEICF